MEADHNGQGIGVAIDPVTLRPMSDKTTVQKRDQKEVEQLKKRAEDLVLTESESGRKVLQLIRSKLQTRIENILATDPETKALVELLYELGVRTHVARKAMETLMNRYVKEEVDIMQ